ncbi:asparaginase [Acetobacter thailandicus]|uniref:asparaginase n=1 Tax=Acetobacter thailandicus TaxID=1502842 RepID=UPI001BAB315E|nr:asparaginase [Acetobacter thailandicus]MBS1002840.1 asparaginase [Acetobacter thailandicus]
MTEHSPPSRILILATGGTIAGQMNARSASGYDAGNVSVQDLLHHVPNLPETADIHAEQIASIGSQNMNDALWFALARRIMQAFEQEDFDATVIIHGTDTLEETAFFLQHVIKSQKPVILTGAMRPGGAPGADGPVNISHTLKVAASPKARERGVMVVFNETIYDARTVSKINTSEVNAFTSVNGGPAGYVDTDRVYFVTPAAPPAPLFSLPEHESLPCVDIIYAHSNMDDRLICHTLADGVKGIVLAGIGDGNASDTALAALDRAVAQGVHVIRASRVGSGLVKRNIEVSDDIRGFNVSCDLSPHKARILLQLLIASKTTSASAIRQAFEGAYL